MWHKLVTSLLFIVLVQSANALPISTFNNELHHSDNTYTVTQGISSEQLKLKTLISDQLAADVLDEEQSDEPLTLPRTARANVSSFTSEIQTNPDYVLVIEFFEVKLTTALFKNLTNPPLLLDWFEQVSANNSSSRLSGWKDSNSLYTSSITYHS